MSFRWEDFEWSLFREAACKEEEKMVTSMRGRDWSSVTRAILINFRKTEPSKYNMRYMRYMYGTNDMYCCP